MGKDPVSRTLLGRPGALARSFDRAKSFVSIGGREMVRLVRERVAGRADAKNVDVFFDCGSDRMWVEAEAFSQALQELVDNAVRATHRGHPVMVDLLGVGEGDVLWQIHDTGEGMAACTLAEIGLAHQRGGVAFAWAVVDAHDGLLCFESAPGLGTTVSVWLPGRR